MSSDMNLQYISAVPSNITVMDLKYIYTYKVTNASCHFTISLSYVVKETFFGQGQ